MLVFSSIIATVATGFMLGFTGRKMTYLHRATSMMDWHPSQLAYGDGGRTSLPHTTAKPSVSKPVATTVSPIDFGGDPTAVNDSSTAFRDAIAALHKLCKPRSNNTLAYPLRLDCGGAVLDLRGGWYSVSEPVRIPAGMGNLFVRGGTIFAASNFHPTAAEDTTGAESFVLILGHNCTSRWQSKGGCTTNVGVQQITLDAKKRAGGCLYLDHTQFSTVGPGIMILGFSTYGITAFGSGGTIIQGVFGGEYPNGDPRGHTLGLLTGTAIFFHNPQHDGYITNSIIWSAKVGVVLHGAAQQIIGVHPWNYITDPADGHQTSAVDGAGLGIVVTSGGARIEDCYLDTVPLVLNITGGTSEHTLVTGNLFLKNASVILSAPRWPHSSHTSVSGIVITENIFSCNTNPSFGSCERGAVILDETGSRFHAVHDTRVERNHVDPDAGYRSTRARRTGHVKDLNSIILDFTDDLLFPSAAIINGSATCTLINGVPTVYSLTLGPATGVTALQLRVNFAQPWTGQVQCTVDQSARSRCAL